MAENAGKPKSIARKILTGLLLGLAIILLIPLAAATWFLSDNDRVRQSLENVVGNLTGRPLSINGEFDFSLGRNITLKGEQVVWVNPAWSSTPNMGEAAKIEVSFDVWSFVDRPVIISNVVASDTKLEFEWTDDEKFNWWFGDGADEDDEVEDGPRRIPLLLDKADLTNTVLRFQHPQLTKPLLIVVNSAEQQQDAENHLQIGIDGDINGLPGSLQGRLGPFPNLIAGGAIDFELKGKGEETDIQLLGKIGEVATLRDTNLEFLLDAAKTENALENLNLPVVTAGPMNVKGILTSTDEKIALKINGPIGGFEINVDAEVNDLSTLQGLNLTLESNGPNVGAAAAVLGLEGLPATAYNVHALAQHNGDGIFIEKFLFTTEGARIESTGTLRNYPHLNESELKLKLDIDRASRFKNAVAVIDLPNLPLHIDVDLISKGKGAADALDSNITLGKLEVDLSGTLAENPAFAGSKINFKGSVPDGRILAGLAGIELTDTVPVDVEGYVSIKENNVDFETTSLKFGKNELDFDGTIPISGDNPITARMHATGPDFDSVSRLLNASDLAPPIEYDMRFDVELNKGKFLINNAEGTLGKTKLKITGNLDAREVIQKGEFRINSEGPSLSTALLTLGIEQIPDEEFTFKTDMIFDADGFKFLDSDLIYANNRISGDIQTPLQNSPGPTKFNLTGSGSDFGLLLSEIGGYEPAHVAFSTEAIGQYDENGFDFEKAVLKAGTATLKFSGQLILTPSLQAKNVKLSGEGAKISDLGASEDFRFADVPFKISATLEGNQNLLTSQNLELTINKSDISGKFSIDARKKPNIELQLKSDLLDLERILAHEEEQLEAQNENSATDDDGRVIPEIEIPYKLLDSVNASVDLDIQKLTTQTITLDEFRVDGTLQDQLLNIFHIEGKSDKGNVDGAISLTPDNGASLLKMSVKSTGVIFQVPGVTVTDTQDHPGHDVDIDITARGKNLRGLAATLNGFIWIQGGGRQIENIGVTKFFGDFMSQLVTIVNPFSKEDPYTQIVCDLYFLEAIDGTLKTAPNIFWRTDKLNIAAEGKIDLETEKIDFKFGTSPRRGIGLSAGDIVNPFTRVDGTLSEPGLALNKTGAVVQGGAAFATVGLSIVAQGLWKRWLGPRKPCEKVTEEAVKIRAKREAE